MKEKKYSQIKISFSILLLFSALLSPVFALSPLHEARYTFTPEIFKVNDGSLGIGAITHFDGDLSVPAQVKFGLGKRFELGARVNANFYNSFDNGSIIGDVGFKTPLSSYEALQMDILFGIGGSGHEGVAVGYTTLRKYAKKVFSTINFKMGFFDGLTGGRGIFAQEFGIYPEFRFHPNFKLKLGLIEGSNVGDLDAIHDTFNLDLKLNIPVMLDSKTELSFDAAFGIFGPEHENTRYALLLNVRI